MQTNTSVWQNRITAIGALLAVLSFLFFVSFQIIEFVTPSSNPYTGLWSFLVLPPILVLGLLLIPLGGLLELRRRRLHADAADWRRLPHFDPTDPHHRRWLAIFVAGTLVVIPLIAVSSYQGYHYTDSTQFCGQVCHSVMHPEYTSYLNSPHARVSCAECHIGPGASWFVKAKISGLRQVYATAFQTFSRPIPTPIEDLRPARETCEQCHWPEKFYGAQLRTRVHFASDEKNTRSEIRILVKTGGADTSMGPPSGIHWHMALENRIEYIATDRGRQQIPWVRAIGPSGKATIYRSDGKGADDPPPEGEVRRIDCVDCHNRPTHILHSPDRAVNISLETGRLDRNLPFIKKAAVEALTLSYDSEEEALAGIESYIRNFYREAGQEHSPSSTSIDRAVAEVGQIYLRNFFPRMRVHWREYPENISHMIFDGCFRCHDGKHLSADKGPISRDCTACHSFLQPGDSSDTQTTYVTGVPPHPIKLEGKHAELNCSRCHTGGRAPDPTCAGCHTEQALFRQGKQPALPGVPVTPPSIMADLDCESCHDMSKPQTRANIAAQCETCHDKGYGDFVQMWNDDLAASRVKAEAALQQGGSPELAKVLAQMDRAVPAHNTDLAEAVYQHIAQKGGKN